MICKKCGGRLGAQSGWPHDNAYVRIRVCPDCGFHSMSLEVLLSNEEIRKVTGSGPWQSKRRRYKY